ncbi:molybdate ABC transporter substrate-binding protein [Acanthopleuribacter pedis]
MLWVLLLPACSRSNPLPVVDLYAASSLAAPLAAASGDFRARGGAEVRINSAASSVLARQIEAGAAADLFISAHPRWITYLTERAEVERVHPLVGNRLVLASHRDVPVTLAEPGDGLRIALADADHVPLGWYSRQALQKQGTWTAWQPYRVTTENAGHTRQLLELQQVDLAVLYAGDVHQAASLHVVTLFSEDDHEPIRYQIATMPGAAPEATAFVAYLRGENAAAIWRRFGLVPLEPTTAAQAAGD